MNLEVTNWSHKTGQKQETTWYSFRTLCCKPNGPLKYENFKLLLFQFVLLPVGFSQEWRHSSQIHFEPLILV